ncbi:hypothetical protein WME91_51915 [Sorangium sp. So ce269]
MNRDAQEKLQNLRQRLMAMEPYPWEPVEAWIAAARPLIKAIYNDHFDDFLEVTKAPHWSYVPRVSSSRSIWDDRPRRDNSAEAAATEHRINGQRAAAAKEKILAFVDGLLDLPEVPPLLAKSLTKSRDSAVAQYYNGDVIMGGQKNTSNISGSTVGAVSTGDYSQATGSVTINRTESLTQEEHRAAINEARKALIDDEDQLEPLIHEALGQFLRMAREIQVEQKTLAEVQAKMKETLDEVWAEFMAKGMKPQLLPGGLKVLEVLAASPAAAEVLKSLLSGS